MARTSNSEATDTPAKDPPLIHSTWSSIFCAASQKPDFKDDLTSYMSLPTIQDIGVIFNLYRDFGAGAGLLVRSSSTIIHVHDAFLMGASRKHPSAKSEWLAFANLNSPSDVFKLETMVGLITMTKIKVPKIAILSALSGTASPTGHFHSFIVWISTST